MPKDARKAETPTRRDWLSRIIGGISALFGASGMGVVGAYLLPSRRRESGARTVDVGPADALKLWESKMVMGGGEPVIIVRTGENEDQIAAFSATCTHLGCLVRFDGTKRHFACPCHGGTFDLSGRQTGGPPPGPLRAVDVVVRNGNVYVTS